MPADHPSLQQHEEQIARGARRLLCSVLHSSLSRDMRIVFRRRLAPRLLRLDRFDETTSYSEVAALLDLESDRAMGVRGWRPRR